MSTMSSATCAVSDPPAGSMAVSVIVCDPTERLEVVWLVPVASVPSRLDRQVRAEPDSAPVSGSFADPWSVTGSPEKIEEPEAGEPIAAVGAWFGAVESPHANAAETASTPMSP